MASIWSRNKIWGGTFTTDVDVSDNTNNASVVPASNFLGLVQGSETDPRNRTKWFTSVIGQLLRAVLHKEEDRATGTNIGVSGTGIEPTVVPIVFVVPEQLPEVDKTTNDFSTPAKSDSNGALTTTNDLFNVSTVTTDRKNKRFVVNFSEAGVLFFKARTWLQSEIQALITNAINGITFPTSIYSLLDSSTLDTLTSSYVQLNNMTYTTPDDGVTRRYLIIFKGSFLMDAGSATQADITVRLRNTTDLTTYDTFRLIIGSGSSDTGGTFNGTLQTIQQIPPNKTFKVEATLTPTTNTSSIASRTQYKNMTITQIL